ncbi:hypothetical protein E4U56_007976, partial [Claviceps arundinis]
LQQGLDGTALAMEQLREQVNISGQLQQMMGRGTEFRGQQSSEIRAVVVWDKPIIQITSTGGRKSLSFMLPAYCPPEGITIVIVPLVALQLDLFKRCMKLKITAHIWKSGQGNPAVSVLFVMPEAAVTVGFDELVRRLQNRGVLDRVVVGECHTVLDGDFRPKLEGWM